MHACKRWVSGGKYVNNNDEQQQQQQCMYLCVCIYQLSTTCNDFNGLQGTIDASSDGAT